MCTFAASTLGCNYPNNIRKQLTPYIIGRYFLIFGSAFCTLPGVDNFLRKVATFFIVNPLTFLIMQKIQTLNGMVVNANTEIQNKIVSYLSANGLNVRDDDGAALFNGMRQDADFCLYVEGSFDNIRVELRYRGFKPERVVRREIMAIDERICTINLTREIPDEDFNDELSNSTLDTIFIMVDGQLQQTTIMEYIHYKLRNKVFKK